MEAIAGQYKDEADKRNLALEKQAAWVEYGAGALIGVLAEGERIQELP
ncbi:hypothetical protein ABT026_00495 [Streptomyces sp. NPDC002734]